MLIGSEAFASVNEDIWDNFPCDCSLCPRSLWSVTAARQGGRHTPGGPRGGQPAVSPWPRVAAHLEGAFQRPDPLAFALLSATAPLSPHTTLFL